MSVLLTSDDSREKTNRKCVFNILGQSFFMFSLKTLSSPLNRLRGNKHISVVVFITNKHPGPDTYISK